MSRERKRRRLLAVATLLIAAGVMAYLAFGGIGENLVYYWSPTELHEAGQRAYGANVRLGGLVEPGSIVRQDDGLTMRFAVTDGTSSVPVVAKTVPPAMFRENIGVVVEGTLERDGHFETQRLMVKHDNEYRAPEDFKAEDMEELMKSLQLEEAGT
jgi:cytochrome c-type biogenesis protein CcmE